MNYRVLFFVIGTTLALMGGVLFFAVSGGAKAVQQHAIGQAQQSDLDNAFVSKGLFALGSPSYAQVNNSCSAPFQRDAYVTLVLHYLNTPRSCEVFVNDRLQHVHRDLRPSCVGSCPNEEFDRTLHLGLLDVRDNHRVRVCCNEVCIAKPLASVCSLT